MIKRNTCHSLRWSLWYQWCPPWGMSDRLTVRPNVAVRLGLIMTTLRSTPSPTISISNIQGCNELFEIVEEPELDHNLVYLFP